MPIYCVNNTVRQSDNRIRHSNVSSTSLTSNIAMFDDLIGSSSNNYYLNGGNNIGNITNNSSNGSSSNSITITNTKSNSHNGANGKNISSCSLMMAINRFRNSVQNMKDTVLIPTRLSDLIHTNSTISLSTPASSFDSVELSTSSNETSMESANVLSASHCTTLTNEHSYTRHNLYEQYKLLHLIDQILSSDAIIRYVYTFSNSNMLVCVLVCVWLEAFMFTYPYLHMHA